MLEDDLLSLFHWNMVGGDNNYYYESLMKILIDGIKYLTEHSPYLNFME